jgi:hypothetical protein
MIGGSFGNILSNVITPGPTGVSLGINTPLVMKLPQIKRFFLLESGESNVQVRFKWRKNDLAI